MNLPIRVPATDDVMFVELRTASRCRVHAGGAGYEFGEFAETLPDLPRPRRAGPDRTDISYLRPGGNPLGQAADEPEAHAVTARLLGLTGNVIAFHDRPRSQS